MPPENAPDSGQNAPDAPLFEVEARPLATDGPNSKAVAKVIARLNETGQLATEHDDYATAAMTLARYVDALPPDAKPYAVAQLMDKHLDALRALHQAPGDADSASAAQSGQLESALNAILDDEAP